ncbi:ABC transporter permease [Flavitalea sp. BT771]|uniref:ABC transporter permease n=1 Tax=Flavitalea sp. BT771 TaxID=3063329 RepID=UPI0026E38DE6|nr:ABC transporter permease [Flavitalea sp. BT771]MDO6429412.1 ABC transporter permease [Flavitalea sp. BT771]MDV6218460.1 ABC transporter permease [Flavitalea sp. BT771]
MHTRYGSINREMLIKRSPGWRWIDWEELSHYRDLLYFLTIRGIRARYAQSVMGVSWAIIQPLATTLIFTVVFGNFAKLSSDGAPYLLFSFLAILPWTYFSSTITDASVSLVQNSLLITKVYFPRMFIPLASALGKWLDFSIGLLVLVVLLFYFKAAPGWELIFLPILLIILFIVSVALGLLFSAMSVQYRDVKHAMPFIIQLLMYLAPVVYSTHTIPLAWQKWYVLNPMVGVVEGFRAIFLHHPMPWNWITTGCGVSIVLFILSAAYFRRMERGFADMA